MVFEVPPPIADCDGGWCVPCNNATGEGDDVAIERGPVGVGEGEFFYALEESDVVGRFFDYDEEGWPLLSRHG